MLALIVSKYLVLNKPSNPNLKFGFILLMWLLPPLVAPSLRHDPLFSVFLFDTRPVSALANH
jgi:hypothetical protein